MTGILSIFNEIDVLPTNAILVTFGVSSRYTNLLTTEGIICRIALNQRTESEEGCLV